MIYAISISQKKGHVLRKETCLGLKGKMAWKIQKGRPRTMMQAWIFAPTAKNKYKTLKNKAQDRQEQRSMAHGTCLWTDQLKMVISNQ